jgi:hypothetical protein
MIEQVEAVYEHGVLRPLNVDSRDPRSHIRVGTAREFSLWFIDRLLGSIQILQETWQHDARERFLGEKFERLKPVLNMLRSKVRHETWPRTDLAQGQFLLLVDYFKIVIGEWQD